MFRVLCVLFPLFFLVSCTSTNDVEIVATQQTADESVKKERINSWFSGKTLLSYSGAHGTQVEYHSPSGGTYLWYPGNTNIVRGSWKLTSEKRTLPSSKTTYVNYGLCYKYGSNSYNPVTGRRGGGWNCRPAVLAKRSDPETRDGDVFGLSKRSKVPFVLDGKKTSINGLRSKL